MNSRRDDYHRLPTTDLIALVSAGLPMPEQHRQMQPGAYPVKQRAVADMLHGLRVRMQFGERFEVAVLQRNEPQVLGAKHRGRAALERVHLVAQSISRDECGGRGAGSVTMRAIAISDSQIVS